MEAVHHGTYRAIKAGERGIVITVPKSFVLNNDLEPGDYLDISLVPGNPSVLIVQALQDEEHDQEK